MYVKMFFHGKQVLIEYCNSAIICPQKVVSVPPTNSSFVVLWCTDKTNGGTALLVSECVYPAAVGLETLLQALDVCLNLLYLSYAL
jgi:hypothetical protein